MVRVDSAFICTCALKLHNKGFLKTHVFLFPFYAGLNDMGGDEDITNMTFTCSWWLSQPTRVVKLSTLCVCVCAFGKYGKKVSRVTLSIFHKGRAIKLTCDEICGATTVIKATVFIIIMGEQIPTEYNLSYEPQTNSPLRGKMMLYNTQSVV